MNGYDESFIKFKHDLKELPLYEVEKIIKNSGIRKKYQHILILYYVEELDYYAISERLNITYNSVGNKLCEARRVLYKALF